MLCSIVIPTVNRPTLERAVQSVTKQDLEPEQHEIIVVNDSGTPLPDYDWLRSPQIQVINTNHCERSLACNVGAAIALGKYIKILHDDDYLLPGSLKALLDLAQSSGDVWVYGALNRVDDHDKLISVNRPEVKGNLFAHTVAGDSIHVGASLLDREVFIGAGCFDPCIRTSEDRDLQRRIAFRYDISCTDYIIANIRVGETAKSSTDWSSKTFENRQIRENALNTSGALFRILDSVKGDMNLRGRCCRAYVFSALLNFRSGRIFIAGSRLCNLVPLVGLHLFRREFWEGFLTRSHWHKYEKGKEESHYQESEPDGNINAQSRS